MKENKLYRLLKSLSDEEWKAFEKFTASPYFNMGRNYLPLLKYFKDSVLKKKKVSPEPEEIYSLLYPGKKFNHSVVNTILSNFTKLTENFLVQIELESSANAKKLALLKQLNQRNCDALFENEAARALKKYFDSPFDIDTIEFLKSMQENLIRAKYKTNFDKSIENEIHKRSDYRFFAFYIWLLNEERDLRIMKDVLNKKPEERMSTKLAKSINPENVIGYIETYYPELKDTAGSIILYFTSRDVERVSSSLYKNYALFQPNLALALFYILEGMIVDNISAGRKEYLPERLRLLQFILEKGLVVNEYQTRLNTRVTENIIYVSLWCKEFTWLKHFLETYSGRFAEDMKENLVKYCRACLLLGEKKYAEALRELYLVGDASITMKVRMKDIELQLLFEMNKFDEIYFAADNYNKLKLNQLVSERHRAAMDANITAYKFLVNMRDGKNSEEPGYIRKILEEGPPSQFGDWILEKIAKFV
ncbi:MAG: hypothetical protein JNK43_10195 [Ignavibacteria bacterium]|nr:hypothetical protein [Ignavibacteria bacterium]